MFIHIYASHVYTYMCISCLYIYVHHVEVRHQHWDVRSCLPPCQAVSLIFSYSRLFDLWTLGQLSCLPLPSQSRSLGTTDKSHHIQLCVGSGNWTQVIRPVWQALLPAKLPFLFGDRTPEPRLTLNSWSSSQAVDYRCVLLCPAKWPSLLPMWS